MTRFLARTVIDNGRDWKQFFADIKQEGYIPDRNTKIINEDRALFQSMFLDLGEVKSELDKAALTPGQTRLYADVLKIPEGLSWTLQSTALVIYARQLVVEPGARVNLDFRSSNNATLLLFTNEVQGLLNVYAIQGADQIEEFPQANPPPTGGVQIVFKDDKPVQVDLTRAQGAAPVLPSELTDLLQSEFLYGSVLYDQDGELALSMMKWLKDWGGVTTDLIDLFYRSASLVALLSGELNAKSNGAEFVPYLSKDIYQQLAEAFVGEVRDFQTGYQRLYAVSKLTQNDIDLAKALRDNKTFESQYVEQVAAQAKSNYDHAVSAAEAAYDKLKKAQDEAALIQIDFEEKGIPAWRRAKIVEAIITLGTAAVGFAVGIGSMFIGNEAGGAAAAGAAVGAAEGVANAAGTAAKTAKIAKQLAEAMEAIKKTVEALTKVSELVQSVLKVANDLSSAEGTIKQITDIDLDLGDADPTGAAEWQVYQIESDAAIKPAVDEGIEFAEDLKIAINKIVIFGQALTAARASEIQEGQNYARLLLQQKLSAAQQKRLDELVSSLKVGEAVNQEMMEEFYRRYVDSKSSLFAAMKGYQAAFRYWALQPSSVQPRIIEPVEALYSGMKQLTSIALDYKNALERFDPPPQPFKNIVVEITDPKVIETLQKTGSTSWTIPFDELKFRGDGRVRLSVVRLWLGGSAVKAGQDVSIRVYSEGNYLDRFQGQQYSFTSKPFQRKFAYSVKPHGSVDCAWDFDNGDCGVITTDGRVDDEVKYAYFEPTPFGQWRLELDSKTDPKTIEKISMELIGSLIGFDLKERQS